MIGENIYKGDDLKVGAKMFYDKFLGAYFHKPSAKFNGQITLFKAAEGAPEIDDNYGLSKVYFSIWIDFGIRN